MSDDIKKRLIVFASVILVSILLILPTFFKGKVESDHWIVSKWLSKPLSLGLDLSGGVYLVYEVKTAEAVKGRLQNVLNGIRAKLRDEKIASVNGKVGEDDKIQFTLLRDAFLEKTQKIIQDNYPEVSVLEKSKSDGRANFVLGISPQQKEKIEASAVTQSIETLRTRVDRFGVSEAPIQKIGEKRVLVQMPGITDIDSVKNLVGRVAKLEFRLIPDGKSESGTVTLKNKDGTDITVEDEVLMGGDAVADANVEMYQGANEIHLDLTSEGRRTFGRITTDNIGRQLAIVLDGVVYSYPTIEAAITTGSARITGGFGMEEAREIKVVLKSGALPASLEPVEERTVGPTLGLESIKKGILAILIGFLAILTFMIIFYKKSGVVAVVSLAVNLVVLVAGLSLFGATLTLPGLAGLALTIGMAVDSNVLIFERIKDELRNGATRDVAVKSGFDKAMSAIVDANVTTLLSGLILYAFGNGPIRGFAVTLCLGILTTIYCAVFCCRLAFDIFELKGKPQLSI